MKKGIDIRKKTEWFWKSGFIAIIVLLPGSSGCSGASEEKAILDRAMETEATEMQMVQQEDEETERIIEIYLDTYISRKSLNNALLQSGEKIQNNNSKGASETDLETVRSIVNELGKNGFAAVDGENQIDMAGAAQAVRFCEKVNANKEAELTVIEVRYPDGFVKYDLQTKDGKVDVVRNYYKYENETMQKKDMGSYPAEYWTYTQDGYIMFFGTWYSEEQYVLTLSEAEEHTAWRTAPLKETCRELNRKYLLPIGYGQNNMFLTDWSEADFGELNFYDMYDVFYPQIKGEPVPYTADDNLGVGAVYRIPKKEFESVIMTHFQIDSRTLQSKTAYDAKNAFYEYKPRGFYEVEYPEYPYPEVVEYTENEDGTIMLTVHAVFPYGENSRVYVSETVVRPLEDGGVQYVSNRIISSEGNYKAPWHTPRLTGEEWEELYGGT